MLTKSISYQLASSFLNKEVIVKVDRPKGSVHPKWKFKYECNYGYIEGIKAPDGDDLDAYVVGIKNACKIFKGKVIAIVHRLNDDDDKLVVTHKNLTISTSDIEKEIGFQEKWFDHKIIR